MGGPSGRGSAGRRMAGPPERRRPRRNSADGTGAHLARARRCPCRVWKARAAARPACRRASAGSRIMPSSARARARSWSRMPRLWLRRRISRAAGGGGHVESVVFGMFGAPGPGGVQTGRPGLPGRGGVARAGSRAVSAATRSEAAHRPTGSASGPARPHRRSPAVARIAGCLAAGCSRRDDDPPPARTRTSSSPPQDPWPWGRPFLRMAIGWAAIRAAAGAGRGG